MQAHCIVCHYQLNCFGNIYDHTCVSHTCITMCGAATTKLDMCALYCFICSQILSPIIE
uniref:Uncharacterized protein n=1 Tax=Anguilla anguilla TaxID=7936 RepID=A0A0E9X7F0_ANGAN